MRLDSHQHFWNYSEDQYPWIQPSWPIRRSFLPVNLEPLLKSAGIDGSIAVQARQTLEESRWLLELADQSSIIKGVVGWVDLRSAAVEDQLAQFANHPKFVGVRHVVQDEPDDDFMIRPEFLRGISKLKQFGLRYDVLIFPKQLPAAIKLVQQFPEQPFVLDHIAKPHIKDGTISPWREQIQELAKAPNLMCKVSGMITEAKVPGWRYDQFVPYLDVVTEAFGVERLLYGSDWPVCLLAGSYTQVHSLAQRYFASQSEASKDAIFGGNTARFYLDK
jgi:L-fuconolactonase